MEASQVDGYRTALETLREDLRTQLSDLGADPDEDSVETDFDAGFADSAHATAERGRVLALVERLRDQLSAVESAMQKIEAGTYGICDNCGNPISPERLEVLPYSTLCVTCKQKESA